jgi:large subunit ribosomal protein L3
MKGILGRKVGMTQVFTKSGELIPVTVIQAEPNIVSQIKTKEKDGYNAIQLAFENKREKLSKKAERIHLQKAKTTPKRFLREIKDVDVTKYQVGEEVKVDIFSVGEYVDVVGTSKGKGFQGVIKRYNFSRGPETHGSRFHRRVGSLGSMRAKRVFKGKKLPGQMGRETVTIQNLEVVMVDLQNNVILIKGSIPGPRKSLVLIKQALKKPFVKKSSEELNIYEQPLIEELKIIEEVKEEISES